MKPYSIVLTAIYLLTTTCFAQQKMGWEVGVISTNYISTQNGTVVKTNAKVGLRAGVNADFKAAHNLSIQPALLFITNGCRQKYPHGTETVNLQTLEIPICLQYWPGKKKGQGLFLGAGPYLAYNISGQVHDNGTWVFTYYNPNGKLSIGNEPSNNIRRIDIGGIVNGGCEFRDGIFFRAYYQLGLKNLSNAPGELLLNRNFGLCVGYMIPSRPLANNVKQGKKDAGKRKTNPLQSEE